MLFALGLLIGLVLGGGICYLYFKSKYVPKPAVPKPAPVVAPKPSAAPKPPAQPSKLKASLKNLFKW